MSEGNQEIPIGDQVEQWLRSKKPDKPPEEPTKNQDTKAFFDNFWAYMDRSAKARAEIPERGRKLYVENVRFREATDLYHDFLSVLSTVPAFKEAVVDTQSQLAREVGQNMYRSEKSERLIRGEVPVHEMLDAIFGHGVSANFKVGDLFYLVNVNDSFLRVEKSSKPIDDHMDFRKEEVGKIKKAAEDPTFIYEMVSISIDNGRDDPDVSMFNKSPRDYLRDNLSIIGYHDYRSGKPDEFWKKADLGESTIPEDVQKGKQLLGELKRGLSEGKYEDIPSKDKRSQRFGQYEQAIRYFQEMLKYEMDPVEFDRANSENLPRVISARDQWEELLVTIPEYKQAAETAAIKAEKPGLGLGLTRIRTTFKRGNNYYLVEEVGSPGFLGHEFSHIDIKRSATEFASGRQGNSYNDGINADQAVAVRYSDDKSQRSCVAYYDAKESRDYKRDHINSPKDFDGMNALYQGLQQDLVEQSGI